jgi:DNA-binding PadR family transcriptional regulator
MADVLGVFEQAVLVAVMKLRGEGYGRTILKEVHLRLARDVTASAVYATLDRLEDKGLVASRAGQATPACGGRARTALRDYRIGRARAERLAQGRREHLARPRGR